MERRRWVRGKRRGFEKFSSDRSQYGAELLAALPAADVLHLHDVTGLLDYRTFLVQAARRWRIVWTLHDMYPFTGGCHYDGGCGRYREGCGCCPQLPSSDPADLSARALARKKEALSAVDPARLRLVTPSRWLAGVAGGSAVMGRFECEAIPNSVNTDVFKPRDRRTAREVLDLPPEALVVLFVAQQICDPRKGFRYLVEALHNLGPGREVLLVTVGIDVPAVPAGVSVHNLGAIRRRGLLALAYSAADVFAAPCTDDNLPTTILEALACGVPVIGFDTGGVPDMVRPGRTGELAPVGDTAAYRAALEKVLHNEARRAELARQCRQIALEEFTPARQAQRYLEVYRQMCGETAAFQR